MSLIHRCKPSRKPRKLYLLALVAPAGAFFMLAMRPGAPRKKRGREGKADLNRAKPKTRRSQP